MIYFLTGRCQYYAWGGSRFIANFTQQPNLTGRTVAEYWLGAHVAAPATVSLSGQKVPLDQFIAQQPSLLGQQSRQQFGDQLPFLLKILDVKLPLSIQLHPNKPQAESGFAAENARGIPLGAAHRIYKDNNHKPEMMIALSDFWLLHGFQTKAKITALLQARPSLASLVPLLTQLTLPQFYRLIMRANQAQLAQWLLPIVEQYSDYQLLPLDNPDYWLCYCLETMAIPRDNLDAGLLCFYLFNLLHLRQGEGIYQAAGIPHAYLRGQNIELMAASDNVIRGGLTPKHVDIDELLKVVDCREIEPEIIAPANGENYPYPVLAEDFALRTCIYQQGDWHPFYADSAEILLVMDGEIVLGDGETELLLSQGQSAFISAGTRYQLKGTRCGYCVLAGLPGSGKREK